MCQADDHGKGALHDPLLPSARISHRRLGHFRRRIERHELDQFGRIFDVLAAGGGANSRIHRILAPSELASAASVRICASSKPGMGRTFVTVNALSVSVPVLSAHRTSMLAASSTAERRVGRTPNFANARAPSAPARVKVAGSATGIDANTAVRTKGMISASGILRK